MKRISICKLKKYKLFNKFLNDETISQFKKYVITGCLSFFIEISILYILKEYVKFNLILANSIAYSIVFWINFLLNKLWTFKSQNNFLRQLILYSMLFIFNLIASDIILHFLANVLGIMYLIAKVIVVGMVVSWNFIIYKKIIYK